MIGRRPLGLLIMAVFCALLATPALADDRRLEVIELKHQLVGDVLPVLEPLVEPGGSISGMNNQLIIKASPDNIRSIREVLARLDSAPRQLMITVRQDSSSDSSRREQGISGRYGNDGGQLQYELDDRQSHDRDRGSYRVRATAGYPAHIQSGQLYPFPRRDVYVAPDSVVVHDSQQYENVSSGFYVLPRLQGDQVTLEIAPRVERIQRERGGASIRLQDVQTVVSGRLGEWLTIGGVDTDSERDDDRLLSRDARQRSSQSRILIRVDAVDEPTRQ